MEKFLRSPVAAMHPATYRTGTFGCAPLIPRLMNLNNLLWIAGLLLVLWVVAAVTKFVVGALLHLLWIAALVLLVVWAYRKIF